MRIVYNTRIRIRSNSWATKRIISVFYIHKHTDADLQTQYKSFRILKLTKHGRTETIKEST